MSPAAGTAGTAGTAETPDAQNAPDTPDTPDTPDARAAADAPDPADARQAPPSDHPPLHRNRDFTRLWLSAGISRFGSCIAMVAFPLLALYHTGSAAHAGLVGFAAALPNLVVQLPAGAFVDRWDRRRVMLWCDVIGLLTVASVAVAVARDEVWLPHLMLAAFVEMSLATFYDLAERAAVRSVVSTEQLPTAMSRNEARGSAIGLLGQPASGLLLSAAHWLPFGFMAAANLLALGMLARLRRDLRAVVGERSGRRLYTDIRDGVSWLWRRKFARFLVGFFAGSNLIFQVLALTVMVIIQRNGGSPADFGIVAAARGIGGIAGSLVEPHLSRRYRLHTVLVIVTTLWVVLMPFVALLHRPVALALVLGGLSFASGILNVAAWVFQVQNTPDEMQGRVNGTARFLGAGFNSLGALGCGYLLDAIGTTRTSMLLWAAVAALAAVVGFSRTARTEKDVD
ncbi:MFS transporter [Kitasatospora sp. NPDC059463]|uniref:MFS transporter n=1 Tax=unclassified Kitasatospora TaxID=2633591 RepID=UPI0036C98485